MSLAPLANEPTAFLEKFAIIAAGASERWKICTREDKKKDAVSVKSGQEWWVAQSMGAIRNWMDAQIPKVVIHVQFC